MQQNDFYNIFNKYESDKVTHHGYHMFYPQFIEKFRKSKDAMIEIGIKLNMIITRSMVISNTVSD